MAAEDSSFYKHHGVDISGIIRALWVNFSRGEAMQGGSTITQQLARNLFLTLERTLDRKIKETILALRMERIFSKDQILEMYLNTIYFGHGAYGVFAASQQYYGKKPSELSLSESAMLAGLIAAPERFTPLRHPEEAKAASLRIEEARRTGMDLGKGRERGVGTKAHLCVKKGANAEQQQGPVFRLVYPLRPPPAAIRRREGLSGRT